MTSLRCCFQLWLLLSIKDSVSDSVVLMEVGTGLHCIATLVFVDLIHLLMMP